MVGFDFFDDTMIRWSVTLSILVGVKGLMWTYELNVSVSPSFTPELFATDATCD
jgi:hypothetical protein